MDIIIYLDLKVTEDIIYSQVTVNNIHLSGFNGG